MKCPFCKKKINQFDGHHIYRCNKNKLNDKYKTKFKYISYNFKIISDKNNLYNDYVIEHKSLPDLRDDYNISYRNIIFLLDYYGIKKRTKKSSSQLISVEKYKETCLEKYGVDNISKLPEVKLKKQLSYKKKKFIEDLEKKKGKYEWIKNESRFGHIDNVYNNIDEDVIKKEYIKIIKQYHNHWNELNDEEKNSIVKKDGKLESLISNTLDRLNLTYIRNFKFGQNVFDFRLSNTYLLIEVNSDFWHANPSFYNGEDLLDFPFKRVRVKKIWEKDNTKKLYVENNGFKVLYIWENDIKDMFEDDLFIYLIDKIKDSLV